MKLKAGDKVLVDYNNMPITEKAKVFLKERNGVTRIDVPPDHDIDSLVIVCFPNGHGIYLCNNHSLIIKKLSGKSHLPKWF